MASTHTEPEIVSGSHVGLGRVPGLHASLENLILQGELDGVLRRIVPQW